MIVLLRQHAPALFLLSIFALIHFAGVGIQQLLRLDSQAVAQGQIFRLITAHFVHLDLYHLCLNSLAVMLGWCLFYSIFSSMQWLLWIGLSAIIVSVGLLFTDIHWYVGFSGILYALLVLSLGWDKRLPIWLRAALVVLLMTKVGMEQLAGEALFSFYRDSSAVVVQSHSAGVFAGLVILIGKLVRGFCFKKISFLRLMTKF